MAIFQKTIEGVENGKELFAKVFTVNREGRINNRIDLPYVSAIPSEFPAEPSAFVLLETVTSAKTFKAPEDGYYQIELFGASGQGGSSSGWIINNSYKDEDVPAKAAAGGGGGGSGGYARSIIKVKKGDTIVINSVGVGSTAMVTINSSLDTYAVMKAVSGGNGTNGSVAAYPRGLSYVTAGSGGTAGTAEGGTEESLNGNNGSSGGRTFNFETYPSGVSGGSGGAAVRGGNAGGNGGSVAQYRGATVSPSSGDAGKSAFVKIYRGNTNNAA